MISNIGFGAYGTNTMDSDNIYANVPLVEITEITHPTFVLPQKQADIITLNHDFRLNEKMREKLFGNKVKKWVKSTLKQAATYMYVLN